MYESHEDVDFNRRRSLTHSQV